MDFHCHVHSLTPNVFKGANSYGGIRIPAPETSSVPKLSLWDHFDFIADSGLDYEGVGKKEQRRTAGRT